MSKKSKNNSGQPQFKRTLNTFHLTMIGVGAIVGAGIFSLTGTAAANYAGPGIIYSFILGGVLSALAGLCYAEMASMIPVTGSAYTYSYVTLGRTIGWIIGWDLILEYAFGAIAISSSWSGYLVSILNRTLGIYFPDTVLRLCHGPWEQVQLNDGSYMAGLWNLPASLVTLAISAVMYRGIKESTFFNNLVVFIKIFVIFAFILMGFSVVDSSFWIVNPTAAGLGQLVPAAVTSIQEGLPVTTFGWPGVLTGAGVVFFAYIGFDMISTTAQECKNPARDIPIGIFFSLLISTVLYVVMSLVMTGVVPYQKLGVADPIAVGIDSIVSLHSWPASVQLWVTVLIKIGALAGLSSGLLVTMLGQSRIFYAMAKDELLPWFDKTHPRFFTPHIATVATALIVSISAGITPIQVAGELVSIGTLLAFCIVCLGVLILRVRHPRKHRPFRAPAIWFVAPAGAATCIWMMEALPLGAWKRLVIWLFIGMVIFYFYGRKRTSAQNKGEFASHK